MYFLDWRGLYVGLQREWEGFRLYHRFEVEGVRFEVEGVRFEFGVLGMCCVDGTCIRDTHDTTVFSCENIKRYCINLC